MAKFTVKRLGKGTSPKPAGFKAPKRVHTPRKALGGGRKPAPMKAC